ncbi:metallophosphoesterase family protein [Mucilaginibacter agri]|uniref:Metallophosphoesterase n=1 Tax=Mucilaginibacter agri TaxID=2695265 RepID=A0A965ZEV3_9SPHI|nr:metallophosphoesterase [Mucilaginibacter agri]NCD69769.1 metallophosphoesterase [Mucilaginibacter agri]
MTVIAAAKYNTPVIKKNQPDDSFNFRPLPQPTGNYPYHLALQQVCPEIGEQQIVFHMVGDTGSIRNTNFQQLIAAVMEEQYNANLPEEQPKFLYHLGDVVYLHGEASGYKSQFFKPFHNYPGPILAIAGNHDSDVNPDSLERYDSLDAFKTVFCDTVSRHVIFSGEDARKSMIQPNVYWTLEMPLGTIIGLHSNVPKYGVITKEQREWFINELRTTKLKRPGKALIICLHHAPYSADINHGSSIPMIEFLEGAFLETGIRPDIVFSGHVHNYQRFAKTYADGLAVPYIVAGAGGFDELHAVASKADERFTANSTLFDGVKLEHYCDNKHGFLKISIKKTESGMDLTGEYYTLSHETQPGPELTAILEDRFVVHI